MTSAQQAAALNQRLLRDMPYARALGVEISAFDGETVTLTAPLAQNVNDKGSAFAGSIASLAALSGWSLLTLFLAGEFGDTDVAVYRSELHYARPIRAGLVARATMPEGVARERLLAALRRKGRGKIRLHGVAIGDGSANQFTMNATYAVTLHR